MNPSSDNQQNSSDSDLEHAKEPADLLSRASEWQSHWQNSSMLARGAELAEFLPMLQQEDLTELQRQFINISLEREEARQQWRRFALGFLGGFLAMGFYAYMIFRGTGSFDSVRIVLSLAIGEIDGLLMGVIAMFAHDLPMRLRKQLVSGLHLPLQIVVCLLMGIAVWAVYQWIFLTLPLIPTAASVIGGLALALGFVIHAVFRPPPYITLIVTLVGIFAPIFLLNSFSNTFASLNWDNPLIRFQTADDVFRIGAPMAILLALGANGQILWQWLFGDDALTDYLNRKPDTLEDAS